MKLLTLTLLFVSSIASADAIGVTTTGFGMGPDEWSACIQAYSLARLQQLAQCKLESEIPPTPLICTDLPTQTGNGFICNAQLTQMQRVHLNSQLKVKRLF